MSDMVNALLGVFFFFVILYWCYGMFATTVVRWSKKPKKNKRGKMTQPPLTFVEALPCYLPWIQVCRVRKALYRSNGPFGILCGISAALVLLRIVNLFIPISSYVMFATAIGMYIGIILHLLVYGIVTADAAKLYGFSWLTIILCFIGPYFMGFFLKSMIPNKMEEFHKEDTFHEHKQDTYIKQRPN